MTRLSTEMPRVPTWDDAPVTGRAGHPDDYEEFCRRRATVLVAAADVSARNYLAGGSSGDQVDAFAAVIGAAWALVDGAIWASRDVSGQSPRRSHYTALESMVAATSASAEADNLGAVIDSLLVSWQGAVPTRQWTPIDRATLGGQVWQRVPCPDESALINAAHQRLGDVDSQDYVAARTRDAGAAMVQALALAGNGDVAAAISEAYRADLSAVEAYLIASALAAGDTTLLTVSSRWALVSASLRDIEELPGDLRAAVSRVRNAIFSALGPQDGARVAAYLPVL